MLRQLLMLMALASGLAALGAPGEARAADQLDQSVEAGASLETNASAIAAILVASDPIAQSFAQRATPIMPASAIEALVSTVFLRADRALE